MLALCWIQKHLMLIKSEMCRRHSQVLPESVNPLAKQLLNLLCWKGPKEALVPPARARGGSHERRDAMDSHLNKEEGALWGVKSCTSDGDSILGYSCLRSILPQSPPISCSIPCSTLARRGKQKPSLYRRCTLLAVLWNYFLQTCSQLVKACSFPLIDLKTEQR